MRSSTFSRATGGLDFVRCVVQENGEWKLFKGTNLVSEGSVDQPLTAEGRREVAEEQFDRYFGELG